MLGPVLIQMLSRLQATGEPVSVFAFDVKNSSESQVNSLLFIIETCLYNILQFFTAVKIIIFRIKKTVIFFLFLLKT